MSELLLAKSNLPPDWIDAAPGEPHVVREAFLKRAPINTTFLQLSNNAWDYPHPSGHQSLVKLLEERHGYPVIITNGAKQGLAACLFSLAKLGWNFCRQKSPWWALIPPLANIHRVQMMELGSDSHAYSPLLLLSPNNPDGHCESPEELLKMDEAFKETKVPLIHDAAYYSHTYLPATHTLPYIGDVQIYSVSKLYGLSGLRLGYVVCRNPRFYKLIQEYMETMTVGVSIMSQLLFKEVLYRLDKRNEEVFMELASQSLLEAKKIATQIHPDVLQVDPNFPSIPGMFLWAKKGKLFDAQKCKINVVDGKPFGNENFVRMNIAFNTETMTEIVKRLNSVVV